MPTYRESGFPELVQTVWFALSGPAGLPDDIVTRLNTEVRRILQLPDVRERLRAQAIDPPLARSESSSPSSSRRNSSGGRRSCVS